MGANDNVTELQLLHQQQMREKREALKQRKARTHRLIVRGAIAENAIDGAENMSDTQFQEALFRATGKSVLSAPCPPQESCGSILRKELSADSRGSDSR